MADLTQPDRIHWIDGSQAEYDFLCDQLVKAGTFTKLNEEALAGVFFWRGSSPNDLARGGEPDVYLLVVEGYRRADQQLGRPRM